MSFFFANNESTRELEGLEAVSSLVLGKAQYVYNGLLKKSNDLTNTVTAYFNSAKKSANNLNESIENGRGYNFTSSKGEGLGTRRGDGRSGPSIDIDPIMDAFGAAGADASSFKLGGKGIIGKIISALGFMKESTGSGDMIGGAITTVFGDITTQEEKPKVSVDQVLKKELELSNMPGRGNGGSTHNSDSTIFIFRVWDANNKEIIRIDTLKGTEKK